MLSDKTQNKDFNVNNFYLNLDFTKHEENFEYKWNLLDHPSNYQMIVTKFFSKTQIPYVVLHESKKSTIDGLKENAFRYFDYNFCVQYFLFNSKTVELSERRINQRLSYVENNVKTFANNMLNYVDLDTKVSKCKYSDVYNEYEINSNNNTIKKKREHLARS